MCSLEEAFKTFSDDTGDTRNMESEKKKKKRRKLLPPEQVVIDPDRPAVRPLPEAELLGTTESYESPMLNAYDSADYFPHPSSDVKSENVYNLEPDWAKVFNESSAPDWIKERLPRRDSETPLQPTAWMDGAPTLYQSIPDSFQKQFNLNSLKSGAESRVDELQRRLDSMFEKLDEMETGRMQSNHLEIIMFVLGGLLLLLIIDLLVKQGTQASILLAAAGGSRAFLTAYR